MTMTLIVACTVLAVGWACEHRQRVRAERWAHQLADRLTTRELRKAIRSLDNAIIDDALLEVEAWADDGCGEF